MKTFMLLPLVALLALTGCSNHDQEQLKAQRMEMPAPLINPAQVEAVLSSSSASGPQKEPPKAKAVRGKGMDALKPLTDPRVLTGGIAQKELPNAK